jgi:hypothetical protein
MIIHKQDVTNLEDILKFLQDYVSNEDLEEKYTELELECLKLILKNIYKKGNTYNERT